MKNDLPEGIGKLGYTVGSATCIAGVGEGKRLFRVEPGNCADHAWSKPANYWTAPAGRHSSA
ncbi:hypothetical protein ABE459_08055 [Pseudomonas sp. TWI923]|uniref:hypothetical protein n=1 Tax=Pseudomonas sp. TWI923 TaxID=3136794 RepID=UPI003207A0F1